MALKPKLMADGATGKVAIFMVDENAPTDRTLLDNPTSNLSRVLFHSDLHYPVIVSKHTGTLSLPSRPPDDHGRHFIRYSPMARGVAVRHRADQEPGRR